MDKDNKNLGEETREPRKEDSKESRKNVTAEEGSKSDPQLTELDGLKKGGVEPHVHPEDKPDARRND